MPLSKNKVFNDVAQSKINQCKLASTQHLFLSHFLIFLLSFIIGKRVLRSLLSLSLSLSLRCDNKKIIEKGLPGSSFYVS